MGKARNRAERTGSMDVVIGTTKLVPDSSGDLEVKDASNNRKKIIASEIKLGTGNDVVIIKRNTSTGQAQFQSSSDGGGSTTEQSVGGAGTVTNPSDLPITGNQAGDLKLITSTNNLMIYNGSGWYKIATITNASPTISSAGDGSYTFAIDGTPVIIEITASDPEGVALQYKYQVTTGSLGSTATVTNSATSGGTYSALAANTYSNNRFFKVTPSTNDAHAGGFSITFSVTDGINTANSSVSSFTLAFDVSGSYVFDKTGDYVTPTPHADFQMGAGDFTIEGFIYARNNGDGGIFQISGSTGGFNTSSASTLGFGVQAASDRPYKVYGGGVNTNTTTNRKLNTWQHFALQKTGGNLKLYIDGTEVHTRSDTSDYNYNNLVLGGYYSTNYLWDGYISNFRIVKGSTVYTPSTTGAGLDFGSSNNTLTTAASHAGFEFGTNDFTIEFFYKWSTNSGYQTVLDHNYNDAAGVAIQSNTNTYKWGIFGSGLSLSYEASDATLGVWHHYAFVRNGNTVKIYRDGVETLSQSKTGTVGGVYVTTFGGVTSQSAHYDKGKISNFRVVKGTALYTSAFTPPTAPLTAISGTSLLLFQENSGSTLSDGSSNNVTITKGSGHSILTGDGPTYGGITVPTSNLSTVTNTKLLTFTEKEPSTITNGSYNLTTTSSRVTANHAGFNWSNTDPFTYEMWYKFTGRSNSDCMFDFGTGNTFQMYVYNNQINMYGLGGGFVIQYGTAGYSLNTWYHAAITGDGSGNVKAYIDGTQVGSTHSGTWNITGSKIRLNGYAASGYTNIGITGFYSDVRFVNGTQVYTGNFTPPSGPLTTTGGTYPSTTNVNTSIPASHTKILTAQNSSGSLVDNSTFGHTLTVDSTVTPSAGIENAPADLSSSSHTLVTAGDVTHSYVSPFAQGSGGSVYFDGTGDHLAIASPSVGMGSGAYTLEYWFYATTVGVNQHHYDGRGTGPGNAYTLIQLGSDNLLRFFTTGAFRINGTTTISANTWYHVALQKVGNINTLYLNGKSEGTWDDGGTTYIAPNNGIGIIGADDNGSGNLTYGYISNFRQVVGSSVYTETASSHSGSIHMNGGTLSSSGSGGSFTMGTGEFTIETWFKYGSSSLAGNKYLFDLGTSDDIRITFASGQINADDGGQVFSYNLVGDMGSLNVNKWYHLAFVRVGTTAYLYLDGVLKASVGSSTFNHNTSTFTLGNYGGGGSYVWTGYLSDFRIVKGRGVYTGDFTPPSGPLTTTGGTYPSNTNIINPTASQTVLLTGNNASSITDVSSTGHTLSASGSVSANSDKPTPATITVPTSKLTAVTNTQLLTCNDSNVINDESSSNRTITANGHAVATRYNPF